MLIFNMRLKLAASQCVERAYWLGDKRVCGKLRNGPLEATRMDLSAEKARLDGHDSPNNAEYPTPHVSKGAILFFSSYTA